MEGAVLCHNRLAEYQACDITPSRLKRPCQPNIPNACPAGQVCNLYSGEFTAMCCPTTVREAVMLGKDANIGHLDSMKVMVSLQ